MTRPSETFDWDRAIDLFKRHNIYPAQHRDEPVSFPSTDVLVAEVMPSDSPPQRCRKDLHDMTPENTYLNIRTGHRRCRACTKLAEQTRRKDEAERKRKQENDYNEEWPETIPFAADDGIIVALTKASTTHAIESASPPEHDIPAEQLISDVLPGVPLSYPPDSVLVQTYETATDIAAVHAAAKASTAPPEDDLAKYRESDSPDTRLLADIATSLRILAGRSSTADRGCGLREPAFMQEIREDLLNGKKISAIKRYRVEAGVSLKEAKEFVESLPEYKQFKSGQ